MLAAQGFHLPALFRQIPVQAMQADAVNFTGWLWSPWCQQGKGPAALQCALGLPRLCLPRPPCIPARGILHSCRTVCPWISVQGYFCKAGWLVSWFICSCCRLPAPLSTCPSVTPSSDHSRYNCSSSCPWPVIYYPSTAWSPDKSFLVIAGGQKMRG